MSVIYYISHIHCHHGVFGLLDLRVGLCDYESCMFALHCPWWRTDTKVANFEWDVAPKFREEMHGSIVWIDCNKLLVHYMWFSLRKVYAHSTYKSTPPIPETVCTYDDKCVRHATTGYIVQFLSDVKIFLICQLAKEYTTF